MVNKQKNIEFGIVVSLVLLLAGVFFHIELIGGVISLLLVALLFPKLYTPFTWLWLKFAELLNAFVNRLLLAVIFFLVVFPIGAIRRKLGNDELCLRQFKQGEKSVFTEHNRLFNASDLEKQY